MKELTNRQKQAKATKKKITGVVLEMCRKRDISDITISEICEAAGVSVGTFYHYFKTKEEILTVSYKDFDNLLEEALENRETTDDIIAEILFVAEQYYDFSIHQERSFALNAYRMHLVLGNPQLTDTTRCFYKSIHELAVKWIDSNRLKLQWNDKDLTDFILRYIRSVVFDWISRSGEYDLKVQGMKDMAIILNGLEK